MFEVRKMGVAAGTFSVALGIGFVMQNGDALAARMGQPDLPLHTELPSLPSLPVQTAAVMPSLPLAAPALDEIALAVVPADVPTPPVMVELAIEEVSLREGEVTTINAPAEPEATVELTPAVAAAPCRTEFSAAAAMAATVQLTLTAPCSASTDVTIHHQGMLFSAMTDESGALTVTAPALTETAVFIADIGGSEGAVAVVSVPDVAAYDRAVLQWQGETGFELHAREFGAEYNTPGHIWHTAAGSAELAEGGTAGFLMTLGNATTTSGYHAQVYTYPSGNSSLRGDVSLTVEAEVTTTNCGRTLAAQTLQLAPGSQAVARDLEMTLPDCDTVGDVLVLNNMLQDLTLASR